MSYDPTRLRRLHLGRQLAELPARHRHHVTVDLSDVDADLELAQAQADAAFQAWRTEWRQVS